MSLYISRRLLRPLLPLVLLLGLAQSVSANFAQDQMLSLGDFTTDVPQNAPDLQFGEAVALAGNWMAVGVPGHANGIGEVWIYERVAGDWLQRTRLVPPVAQVGSRFGAAVDIYEAAGLLTVIVGAPLFDAAQIDQGRAYIYSDTNAAPDAFSFITTTINPTSAELNGHFGASVALYADSAAIGSPAAGATDSGQVLIRGRNVGGSNAWGVQASKAGNAGNRFGTAVDLHGEYLIVGAPAAANAVGIRSGQVYVYRRDLGGTNAWGIKHTLSPPSAQAEAAFGHAVGIWDSDISGTDSPSRSMVGAPLTDTAGFADTGSVVFFNDGVATLTYDHPGNANNVNAQQGYSVALEGNLAVAGRPAQIVSGQARSGQINTFSHNGTVWATNTLNLTRTGAQQGDLFGHSVDVSGALAVAAAPNAHMSALEQPPGAPRAGGVSTFEHGGISFAKVGAELIARFEQPNRATSQNFGQSTDIDGEWLAVGVPQDNQKGNSAGAVQMYRQVSGVWTPHSRLTALHGAAGDAFGKTVAVSGNRLVVGAPNFAGFPATTANSGAIYLFEFTGTHWVQRVERASPNPSTDGYFGYSVALHGDVLAVGAYRENGLVGRIYAFRSLSDLSDPLAVNVPGLPAHSATGWAVSVYDPAAGVANNEVIAVGAPAANNTHGAAYVLSGPSFSTVTPLVDPEQVTGRFFGYAVSIFNGRVAVGAPTMAGGPGGAVFVFSGSGYETVTTLVRPTAAGQFGFSLDLDEASLLVGAPVSSGGAGLAAVFNRAGSNWTEAGQLRPAVLTINDNAGAAVALQGGRFVLGVPLHEAGAINNSGAAFVYSQAPEVSVTPTTLSVAEAGTTTDTFVVALNQTPGGNVTIPLSFDSAQIQVDTGAGLGASPQTITLTPATAVAGVTVTVRAVNDAIAEPNPHTLMITTGATSSSISRFDGLQVADVSVAIADDDVPAVEVVQSGGSTQVSEDGATDSYTLRLTSQPTANVTIRMSFDSSQLSVDGDTDGTYDAVFTSANWSTPRTITVAAVNDSRVEANPHSTLITQTLISTDPLYAAIDPDDVSVTIIENDFQEIRFAAASSAVAEPAGTHMVTLMLNLLINGPPGGSSGADMSANIVFTAGTAGVADASLQTSQLIFPAGSPNGSTRTVSLDIVNDRLLEGNENFSLGLELVGTLGTATGTHTVTIIDDEAATLGLVAGPGSVAESAGTLVAPVELTITGSGTGALALASAASVVVNHTPGTASSPADYSVATSMLTFAAGATSGTQQDVTVAVVDDRWVEGDESFTLGLGAVTATGSVQASGSRVITIEDNDTASFGFMGSDRAVSEAAGIFSMTVMLTVEATGTGSAGLQNAYSLPVNAVAGTASTPADFILQTTALNFTAGAVSGSSLPINVAIVDDLIAEGDEDFQLQLSAAGMPAQLSLGRASTTVTILDNDVPGITLTESAGGTAVVEGVATDSYTLVLTSQPTAPVTIAIAFDAAQLEINGNINGNLSLVFTAADWDQERTLTVVAVDDTVVEANPHSSSIVHLVSSADPLYGATSVPDVVVSIGENDQQQITFVAASSQVAETAGSHVVMARLSLISNGVPGGTIAADMRAAVTLALGSASADDVSLSTTEVVFPAGSPHNSTLPVTLAISNDRLLEGDETLELGLELLSGLGTVSGSHGVTINDDESAQIGFVEPASTVAESVGTASTPVRLDISGTGSGGDFALAAAVSVAVQHVPGSAASPADYSVPGSVLSFAAGSVSGSIRNVDSTVVDDRWVEGPESFTLGLGAVTATGAVSAAGSHVLTITDNDSASFGFAAGDDSVSEAAGTFSKPVLLTVSAVGDGPAGLQQGHLLPVQAVQGTATTPADFSLQTPTLSFADGALDGSSQQVTVALVDDLIAEGDESFQLQLSAAGMPAQLSLGRASTSVTIIDNDVPGVTLTPVGGSIEVAEGGAAGSFTAVLDSQPLANVTLSFTGSQVDASPLTLEFTPANWNQARTVAVSAIDDAIAEGPHSGSIATSVSSTDASYAGLAVTTLSVAITDNDTAAIVLTPSGGGIEVTEGGAGDSYTIALGSEPTAEVTLSLSGVQVEVSPLTLVFSAANWNQPRTVSVSAIDDAIAEGPHSGSVSTVVSSADSFYDGLSVPALAVDITDNDNAGITLVQSGGSTDVTEGGADDSYTIVLASEPTAAVSINLSGTQVSLNPVSLQFTAANWNVAQTVNVSAIDDAVVEGPHTGTVSTQVSSADPNYQSLVVPDLQVNITDNDRAGLTIADASVQEGNSGTRELNFPVTLSVAVPQGFTVAYASSDGTAQAGSDYAAVSGTLSFSGQAGEVRTISVQVNGDAVVEADETLQISLSTPSSALVELVDAQAEGRILNDDTAVLRGTPVVQAEGDSGVTIFSFVLELQGQVQDGFSVRALTRDDTAQAGSDYHATDLMVSFDGSLNPSRSVPVGVIGDTDPEAGEVFWLDLSTTQANLQLDPASVRAEIVNDDLYADLSVTSSQLPGPVGKGEEVVFVVVVRNHSEVVDVPSAQFGFVISPALQAQDWTCEAGAGASCPASGSGLPSHSISLDAGASLSYRIRTQVRSSTLPDDHIGSTASVSLSAPYSDPNPANNTATTGGAGADRLFRDGFEAPAGQ